MPILPNGLLDAGLGEALASVLAVQNAITPIAGLVAGKSGLMDLMQERPSNFVRSVGCIARPVPIWLPLDPLVEVFVCTVVHMTV